MTKPEFINPLAKAPFKARYGNFIGGDYLIRPKFSYAFTDALKGTLGMDYYGGPMDRPLGQLQVFNSVFVEGKYSF